MRPLCWLAFDAVASHGDPFRGSCGWDKTPREAARTLAVPGRVAPPKPKPVKKPMVRATRKKPAATRKRAVQPTV